MAISLTTITNLSKQVVPVLVNSVAVGSASGSSDLASTKSGLTAIAPGSSLAVESSRIDNAQLDQLRRLKLISYVAS